ncbi:MAG: NAD(P)-dependent oxidoreductase [Marinobacter sp.]
MRALVTGGAGFIAGYLIPALVERGVEVVAFDLADRTRVLDGMADRVKYVKGDLSSDVDLYRLMAKENITDIFHLGALLAGPCEDDPLRGFRVNFGSTQVLLDAAVALGVRRFVMLSSISVFGRDVDEPVRDDAVKNPETVYGQTKLASEHLLRWYANKRNLDTRALRFTWVFGPGRVSGITALYSSKILDAFALDEQMEIPNPDERGDWLYIMDAVKAIITLWEAEAAPQRVYNIAGGVHSIREVVEVARNLRPNAPVTLAKEGTKLSPYPVSYNDTPARLELGWAPDYDIKSAVEEHIKTASSIAER